MRTTALTLFLFLTAIATNVRALDLFGSNAMAPLTRNIILNCPGAAGINYLGGSAGTGLKAMSAGTQAIAPFTGSLTTPLTCTNVGTAVNGNGAQRLNVALDGVAVAANSAASAGCGGVAFSRKSFPVTDRNTTAGIQAPGWDPVAGTYTTNGFADFIRLLFFGIHHDAAQTRDCDSDARRSLVATYTNFFQNACGGGVCAGKPIRHVWRRDDFTGTSDSFISLVGVPSVYRIATSLPTDTTAQQSNPYCNAGPVVPPTPGPASNVRVVTGFGDFLDNDPIRVTVSGNGRAGAFGEQVSGDAKQGHLKSLGLVLTVFAPDTKDVPASETYPAGICGTAIKLLPSTSPTYTGLCPANNSSFTGKCFAAVISNPDGTFNANCSQSFAPAGTCPALVPAGTECRGANLWLRKPDGTLQRDTSLGTSRLYTGAYYRIHNSAWETIGTGASTIINANDEQIGSLVGKSDPCSIGFAARPAVDPPAEATGLAVGGNLPDVASIQRLVTDGPYPTPGALTYPLARKIFLASIQGFAAPAVTPDELALAKCFVDDAVINGPGTTPANLLVTAGFVPLPVLPGHTSRYTCDDFDESAAGPAGCGAATNNNACASNPAPLPTGP